MCAMRRALLFVSTTVCLLSLTAFGQDAPSLGETARQTRQQEKAQPGNAAAAPKAAKIVTDDDAPQPAQDAASSSPSGDQDRPATSTKPASQSQKLSAEEWKERILAQKNGINAMQAAIDKLNDSIHFVGYSCKSCKQWNERQLEKKQEVERARSKLEAEKKRLAEMQEAARQQGYGGSVYDP